MYSRFPYPSPAADTGDTRLKELANLLWLFGHETKYDFTGKKILDAGTGTGHRLSVAAGLLDKARFTAIDMVDASLEVARSVARAAGVTNVDFAKANLVEDLTSLGAFDMVMCMGVLHHTSDPLRAVTNLAGRLTAAKDQAASYPFPPGGGRWGWGG